MRRADSGSGNVQQADVQQADVQQTDVQQTDVQQAAVHRADVEENEVRPGSMQPMGAALPRAKRSRNLRLVLMVATAPLALAGCEGEPTGQMLASVEDCKTQQQVPVAQCTAGHATALAEHQRLAPRFESQADCSAQFDGCTALPADASQGQRQGYIPPMGGFLLGYVLGNTMGGGYRVGGASPLYRDYRSGGYLKPNGDLVGKSPGQVTGRRGNTALPARAMTVSRSGFGSSASARGGFGSGRGAGG